MPNFDLIEIGRLESDVQRVRHIRCSHRSAQLPSKDVTREVVESRRQIEPSPADHLEVGEVGLPQLVRFRRLVLELINRLHQNMRGAGDQVLRLEKAVNGRF